MSSFSLSVQYAEEAEKPPPPPPRERVRALVRSALQTNGGGGGEIGVRFVGEVESAALNGKYRRRNKPTNVLSFAYESSPQQNHPQAGGAGDSVLGDIIICCPVVAAEARAMRLPPAEHYARLIVHGVLHLRGYRHDTAAAAEKMESAERRILSRFNIAPPR